MRFTRDDTKTFAINIISSIIFQIALLILSSSGITYAVAKIVKSLKDNTVTISIMNLMILVVSCIVASVLIISLIKKFIKKHKKDKENYLDNIDDYYFSEYQKHITIYKEGNGIIIHKFKVVVNDVNKFKKIRRKLNIEDGKKNSNFPSLDLMMKTKKADRFNSFGFWYSSENGIISEIKEWYWDNHSSNEDKKAKSNPQEVRWVFNIDRNKVKEGKPYEINYVISVPGLSALRDGKLDKQLLHDDSDEISTSNMHVGHKIQNLKYILSFEEGIELDTKPQGKCVMEKQDDVKEVDISCKEDYDLLYKKFVFEIKNPPFGSDINISWKYNII